MRGHRQYLWRSAAPLWRSYDRLRCLDLPSLPVDEEGEKHAITNTGTDKFDRRVPLRGPSRFCTTSYVDASGTQPEAIQETLGCKRTCTYACKNYACFRGEVCLSENLKHDADTEVSLWSSVQCLPLCTPRCTHVSRRLQCQQICVHASRKMSD